MKKKIGIKKIAYLGLALSFCMLISYVESLLPVFPFAPGVKLGLSNCFILMLLYLYGPGEAALINLLRVLLSSLLFGNMYSMVYSLAGAILSFLAMWLFYKKKEWFSPIGIGLLGGFFHNLGQFLIAFFVTKTPGLIYYLPILAAMGLLCGSLTGTVGMLLMKRLESFLKKEGAL